MTENKEWFESWFDSPYHSILYKHRDELEAKKFIDNLFAFLQPDKDARMLDIACGDGRHAAYMSEYGKEVIGIDLSEQRIKRANALAKENLSFYRQDMRNVFRSSYFDYAFNFFTSFGYFKYYRDNILAAESFAKSLKPNGILVLDYMNVDVVLEGLVNQEKKESEGISFCIHRKLEQDKIIKTIQFAEENGAERTYKEVVSAFRLNDFEEIFASTTLQLIHIFGDYDLSEFNQKSSPRLIMIFKKP